MGIVSISFIFFVAEVIEAHGGDVIKFAGDALMAVWSASRNSGISEKDKGQIFLFFGRFREHVPPLLFPIWCFYDYDFWLSPLIFTADLLIPTERAPEELFDELKMANAVLCCCKCALAMQEQLRNFSAEGCSLTLHSGGMNAVRRAFFSVLMGCISL